MTRISPQFRAGRLRPRVHARSRTRNQLRSCRRYVAARGCRGAVEFVDRAVSGSRDRRPALDAVLTGVKRRQFDVLVCWRLDSLGRSLKHLVTLLDELQALGVAFVSLQEGIDATTPAAGSWQMHILAAIAEFELRSHCRAGAGGRLARAKANGRRLGQKPVTSPRKTLHVPSTSASDAPPPSWASRGRCCTGHGCPADLSESCSRTANRTGLGRWPNQRPVESCSRDSSSSPW